MNDQIANDKAYVPTINVAGKAYKIPELPQEIQDLIAVYQVWENELTVQKREVFKLEGALRSISTELESRFATYEASLQVVVEGTNCPDPV